METIRDFYEEFLVTAISHKVEFIIFGGFAVNLYGFSRVTEDLDIWINPALDNLNRLRSIIVSLGFPDEHQLKNFSEGDSILLRLIDNSYRIDLMSKLNIRKSFHEAYQSAEPVSMPYGTLYFLGYDDLIDEKIRARRPKDLLDVEQLRLIRGER